MSKEASEAPDSEGRDVDPSRLLGTIRGIVEELHPHRRGRVRVELDGSLDRDLGLDSLARVELLVRLERAFGVSLPEQAAAAAETPRDLLRALASAGEAARPAGDPAVREVAHAGDEDVPAEARTLVDVLEWHVRKHPDRTHIHLYGDDADPREISYRDLSDGARRAAAGLRARDVEAGDAVAIMLPTCAEYFHVFLGTLLVGAIPVPIYPPARPSQIEEHVARHARILDNARATVLVSFERARAVAALLRSRAPGVKHVVRAAEIVDVSPIDSMVDPAADDVAFLQYTSGSTGAPKGVVLTHGNILASVRAMGEALEADSSDVFVSWLPLYHDMGLIGAWLGSLYYGMALVLMSPLAFLRRPERWLWSVHRHRGTLSGGPNFAWELCLERVRDEDIEGLDLGSWRLAFNGAEPVSAETLERFAERFGAYGLDRGAIAPVYGLAEATLGVAFPPLGRGPLIDVVERGALEREGRARPASAGHDDVLRVVACGQPLPGFEVRVVDGSGRELPDRREGGLEFRGPSTTSGYYRNPEATRALFHDGWLDSGDRAYVADGDVYPTSREKDVIIRAGRNIYPYELEQAIGAIEGVRKGCVAVFGAPDPRSRTERLVVVAETRVEDDDRRERIAEAVRDASGKILDTPPDDVLLAAPHTVLKTSSGKIRRAAMRELYEQGRLSGGARAVWLQVLRAAWSGLVPQLRAGWHRVRSLLWAGWVWLAFLALAVPTWCAVALAPSPHAAWSIARTGARALLAVTGTGLRVEGTGQVPLERPYVLVSNHASYLDGLVLAAALPEPVAFVAKRELEDDLVPRVFLRRLGVRFVERFDHERSVEDARRLGETLAAGRALAYFPEGTFRRMPGLLPFHLGAFTAAVAADVPVVPVAIRGTRSMLRAGGLFPRPGNVRVSVAAPVECPPDDGERSAWDRAVRLRDDTRAAILALCGEPDLARERAFS